MIETATRLGADGAWKTTLFPNKIKLKKNRSQMLRNCEKGQGGVVGERLVVSLAAPSQLDLLGSWLLRTGQGSSQFQFQG